MKQQTIETGLCTLLVVELPTGANNPEIQCSRGKCWIQYSMQGAILHKELLDVTHLFSLLNRLPEVTEEQSSEIVEKVVWFYNYNHKVQTRRIMFNTALESLDSLLESEGVCFENKVTHPIDIFTKEYDETNFFHRLANKRWQTAQEQVWDRNLCYLFKKVK